MDDKDFLNYCGINKNDLINIENKKFKKANEVYTIKYDDWWYLYKNTLYRTVLKKYRFKEIKTNGKWKYVEIYGTMNSNQYWNYNKYIYYNRNNNYCGINRDIEFWTKKHVINGFYYYKTISMEYENKSWLSYLRTPNFYITLTYKHNYCLDYFKDKNMYWTKNNILKINNYHFFIFG